MREITFNWQGKKVKAYEFNIAGMTMVSMAIETLYEIAIVQEIKAAGYPYMDLNRFANYLAASGYDVAVENPYIDLAE